MNEMYNMGLALHSFGTVGVLVAIFANLFLLISSKDLAKYRRMMTIFMMPLTLVIFGTVLYSGVVMMAAKHLDFTIENIAMILLSLLYIVLEVKRLKTLKHINAKKEHAFALYKGFARRILQVEFLLVLLISLWMWLR